MVFCRSDLENGGAVLENRGAVLQIKGAELNFISAETLPHSMLFQP